MKTQHATDALISELAPQLADSLEALTALAHNCLSERDQHKSLCFTLDDMARKVADTVRNGALPLPAFRAWIAASHIVKGSFGAAGELAWGRASSLLTDHLAANVAQQSGGAPDKPQA